MTSTAGHPETETTTSSSVSTWIAALAQAVPNPGGGAAAGVMLGIATALTSMVAGYTDGTAAGSERLETVLGRAELLRHDALRLADDDARASLAFAAAYRLPHGAERNDAIRRASIGAAASASQLGHRAADAVGDLEWLGAEGNPALIADVVVGAASLRAALAAAKTNVGVDLAALLDLGDTRDEIQAAHPGLWADLEAFDAAIARIDALTDALAPVVFPTHVAG